VGGAFATTPFAMKAALQAAERAAGRGEVPVGAALVGPDGRIIAVDGNRVEEQRDPTAHAELLVVRAAAHRLGTARLVGCDLYVTLEPCPMCAHALALARIRRLYYGAEDPKGGGVDHGPRVLASTSCHHRVEVYGLIAEERAAMLLRDFFKVRR
jgi:tRNA(Arg) A34 adenosine deaminase TadA